MRSWKSLRYSLADLLDPARLPGPAGRSYFAELPYVLRALDAEPGKLVVLSAHYQPIGAPVERRIRFADFPEYAFARSELDLGAEGVAHEFSGGETHRLWAAAPPNQSLEVCRDYRRRLLWVFGVPGLERVAGLLDRALGDLGRWEKPRRITCRECGGIDSRGPCERCGRCDACSQRYVDGDPAGPTCLDCHVEVAP